MPTATLVSQRNVPAGVFTGPAQDVAANVNNVELSVIMNDADVVDPANSLSLLVERSFDGGATWQPWGSSGWQGDPGNFLHGTYHPPGMALDRGGAVGAFKARITATLNNPMFIGLKAIW